MVQARSSQPCSHRRMSPNVTECHSPKNVTECRRMSPNVTECNRLSPTVECHQMSPNATHRMSPNVTERNHVGLGSSSQLAALLAPSSDTMQPKYRATSKDWYFEADDRVQHWSSQRRGTVVIPQKWTLYCREYPYPYRYGFTMWIHFDDQRTEERLLGVQ